MTLEAAETLGLKALIFLANQPERLTRLMDVSGLDAATLRMRASEPEILCAILDHVLTDDELVLGLCAAESLEPRMVHIARAALAAA